MKNNYMQWLLVLAVFAVLGISFWNPWSASENNNESEVMKHVELAGQKLNVEVADTNEARVQGLSHRTELGEKNSMLFVFDSPGIHAFWMKDMNFPIDMIWLGEDQRVVHIQKNATPESYPQTYGDGVVSKYVLETVAGFAEKNNVKIGDRVEFDF